MPGAYKPLAAYIPPPEWRRPPQHYAKRQRPTWLPLAERLTAEYKQDDSQPEGCHSQRAGQRPAQQRIGSSRSQQYRIQYEENAGNRKQDFRTTNMVHLPPFHFSFNDAPGGGTSQRCLTIRSASNSMSDLPLELAPHTCSTCRDVGGDVVSARRAPKRLVLERN